jgi:hypothetical protein
MITSSIAQGNLITNGGFESPNIGSGWTYGQDPGGWQGDNIEVWASGFQGVNSYEGTQHGELNAHPNDGTSWSIYQSFQTTLNALYDISFAYSARRNSSEAFLFSLADNTSTIFNETIDDHDTGQWSLFSDGFVGTGNMMTLRFTSITPDSGTLGNFLDAVSVVSVPGGNVPEPGIISLLAAGLLMMGFSRRRNRS